jgi:hypothetical protein
MTGNAEAAAEIPSGARRMAPFILSGISFLTVVYASLCHLFAKSPSILGLPPPAPDFCRLVPEGEPCYRPDLFAFQVSSGLAIFITGSVGFWTWHVSRRAHTAIPPTPEGRLFGYLPEAEWLASVNFTFQFWDFFISLLIPEHRTPLMLCHHLIAATVGWFSIRYTYLQFYGVFFLGCSELSSIFLVFVDLGRYFPPVPGTIYDSLVNAVCGPLFAAGFIYYRVLLWWPVSYQLLLDITAVMKSGQASKLRPTKEWVLYLYLGLNLPLGLLQLYWLTLIFDEGYKVVLG